MGISKFALTTGIVLAAFAVRANAQDITFSKSGSDVSTNATLYSLGTMPVGNPVFGGASGSPVGPQLLTSGFSGGDSLELSLTDGAGRTNLHPVGGAGAVLKWNGSGFTNVSGSVFADADTNNGSDSNEMTTNPVPANAFLTPVLGPSVIFADTTSPLGGAGSFLQLALESSLGVGDATPPATGSGIYLVLMQAQVVVDGSAPSAPFALLLGYGTVGEDFTADDLTSAQSFTSEFITPEPASFALLAIGSVLMLRRNRNKLA